MNNQSIDLAFTISGSTPIPADHGYHLYAAISRILPAVHQTNRIAVHPLRGRIVGDRQMQLCDWSRLTIRTAAELIADLLPLAGKQLNLAGRTLRIGVPQVLGLIPATAVRSRLVTIKIAGEEVTTPTAEIFQASAIKKLDELGISSTAQMIVGKRRTLRIKDREVVGYEVIVQHLTAEESLNLQISGLGGRRHMGCGVFVGWSNEGERDGF